MSLSNINIVIGNGNMGQIALSDDGIAGLILTGMAVSKKLDLNKVYALSGTTDLKKLGIEQGTSPLLHKELTTFCTTAGESTELHLTVVSKATTLAQMCATAEDFSLKKLVGSAAGRTRLVGINYSPPTEYPPMIRNGLDTGVQMATQAAQNVAGSFLSQLASFHLSLPAIGWNGDISDLYQPRRGNCNRVAVVLASDGKFGNSKLYSAAIGQVPGRVAKTSVHQNLERIRSDAIAGDGLLTDGKTPREHYEYWLQPDGAGYILYRGFVGKSGYCLNGDAMAIVASSDYCFLPSDRVTDKTMMIAYQTYIDDILDSIQVGVENGTTSTPVCKGYEANIIHVVNTGMAGEINSFSACINLEQNILADGRVDIVCITVPLVTLREITINLSLKDPAQHYGSESQFK